MNNNIKIPTINGITLYTKNKYVEDDSLPLGVQKVAQTERLGYQKEIVNTEIVQDTEEKEPENKDTKYSYHFTDSSYFDILDCLLEAFCIHVSEKDAWDYPEFVQDIRNYIWDICCNVLGVKNNIPEFEDEDKPKMVNLDDVCKWLMEQAGNYSVEVADAIENDIVPQLKKVMGE